MKTKIDVGIDFGTTNSAIGRAMLDGRIFVGGPHPSVGLVENGRALFGIAARERLTSSGGEHHLIRDLKLALTDGRPLVLGGEEYDPVDLAATLFLHLKEQHFANDEIRSAVLATPVRVGREHRANMREAAARAGFGHVRFVYEPTAALISAWEGRRTGEDLILVVDWGGGTLDLAVIRVEADRYLELGVDGDVDELGGSRIDQEISRRLLEKPANRRAREAVQSKPGGPQLFHELVEERKIALLEDPYAEDTDPERIGAVWLPVEVELRPRDVFEVMREFAAQAGKRIPAVLVKSGVKPDQITHVLFAGGVCRSEVVREEVARALPWAQVIETPGDPQLQTARGCARLADPRNRVSVELGADLAVRQCDDSICVVMSGGQSVELNSYRIADFLVTDVHAREAVFDLGVCSGSGQTGSHSVISTRAFQSLDQLYVPTGEPLLASGAHIPDIIRMHVGVDSELCVGVHLLANRSGQSVQKFLSGVPLLIRVEEAVG